jgi:hypothetical protein
MLNYIVNNRPPAIIVCRGDSMVKHTLATVTLLALSQTAHAALIGSTSYNTSCWATTPAPSLPQYESATDQPAFSSFLLCVSVIAPGPSGYSSVDTKQESTVSDTGIISTGSISHYATSLLSGLGISELTVMLTPTVNTNYEFLTASGKAETTLQRGFSTIMASFLIELVDDATASNLLTVTAAGTTGSLSGVLLAGQTYTFRARAEVQESPLYNWASYDVNLALTVVPVPATAPLLLSGLAALWWHRKPRGHSHSTP